MLRGVAQPQLTPRHRPTGGGAHSAVWVRAEGSFSKESQKRPRLNSGLIVMVVALALAALLSFAAFSRDGERAAAWQSLPGSLEAADATPGRRHRKLEREPQVVQGQLDADGAGDETLAAAMDAELATEDGLVLAADARQDGLFGDGAAEAATAVVEQSKAEAVAAAAASEDQQQEQQQDQDQDQQQQQQQQDQQRQQDQEQQQQQQDQERQQVQEGLAAEGDAGNSAERLPDSAVGAAEQVQGAGAASGEYETASAGQQGPGKLKSPYQQALESCVTLACLREAAAGQRRYKGQYLFPHFLIIGWQKCATTSLFHHLKDHPDVLMPVEKEPEFFSYECNYDPLGCSPEAQKEYIEETLHLGRVLRHNLRAAMFEGSTHYAREGHRLAPTSNTTFARSLYEVFPWVRLIASMREPISRYLSMLGHNLDKNTYTCLNKHDSLFECLELELPWNNYSTPVQAWLDAFPRRQLLFLQYERLTDPDQEAAHLRTVKSFLGVDPELPAGHLGHSNTRANRLGHEPEGWPMKKWQYQRLIEVVRPDVDRLMGILKQHGLGDPAEWTAAWEKAWQANLAACDAEGNCSIH